MPSRALILLFAFLAAAQSRAAGMSDLRWLLGCWQSEDGSEQEAWVEESDGSLLGFGVTVAGSRVTFYELLTITADADGVPVYTAHLAGQAPTSFVLSALDGSSVTFSNPAHDFPQEIAYRLEGETLIATISALDGERPRTFPKRRCD